VILYVYLIELIWEIVFGEWFLVVYGGFHIMCVFWKIMVEEINGMYGSWDFWYLKGKNLIVCVWFCYLKGKKVGDFYV